MLKEKREMEKNSSLHKEIEEIQEKENVIHCDFQLQKSTNKAIIPLDVQQQQQQINNHNVKREFGKKIHNNITHNNANNCSLKFQPPFQKKHQEFLSKNQVQITLNFTNYLNLLSYLQQEKKLKEAPSFIPPNPKKKADLCSHNLQSESDINTRSWATIQQDKLQISKVVLQRDEAFEETLVSQEVFEGNKTLQLQGNYSSNEIEFEESDQSESQMKSVDQSLMDSALSKLNNSLFHSQFDEDIEQQQNDPLIYINSIDKKYLDNPAQVPHYAKDIFSFLYSHQDKFICRDLKELNTQHSQLNEAMRSLLVDWIMEVAMKYGFRDQTFFLGVQLLDIYTRLIFQKGQQIKRENFQKIGVASLLIAAKIEEIYPPSAFEFTTICDGAYSLQQLLDAEVDICIKLSFEFSFPTPLVFYNRYSSLLEHSPIQASQGLFILHTCSMQYELSAIYVRPSLLACCCCYIAEGQVDENWNQKIIPLGVATQFHTAEEFKIILPMISRVIKEFKGENFSHEGIKKKFSAEKYHKVWQEVFAC